MTERSFSVVVAIHDSLPDLERLLDSIDRRLAERPQLIVVDSGSSDDGPALARERGAEVIELEGNLGFGAANNAGVARAEGDVCILMNPDVELLDDRVLGLVAHARAQPVLVAPRLLDPEGRIERNAHPLPGTVAALLPALVHPRALPRALRLRVDPWRAERERRVGWVTAACIASRTELLRRLGPFDPGVFLFYEDMDLCLRAREAGVAVDLRPDVALRHRGAHSTRPSFGGEPHELLARRRREVMRARRGPLALALDDAAQALTFATRAAGRRLLGRDARRERAQLAAVLRARAGSRGLRRRPEREAGAD